MDKQKQRISIAESLGWSYVKDNGQGLFGMEPGCESMAFVPEYLNDLNACHEFEKTLTKDQWQAYLLNLVDVVSRTRGNEDPDTNAEAGFLLVTATAEQRAEACLRTKGLWQGEGV